MTSSNSSQPFSHEAVAFATGPISMTCSDRSQPFSYEGLCIMQMFSLRSCHDATAKTLWHFSQVSLRPLHLPVLWTCSWQPPALQTACGPISCVSMTSSNPSQPFSHEAVAFATGPISMTCSDRSQPFSYKADALGKCLACAAAMMLRPRPSGIPAKFSLDACICLPLGTVL